MNGKRKMARKGAGRSFARDRAGAAEIIGDVLLVAMSVIMVSALALQLSTVPDPADSVRADLVASYDGDNITVLHMGGEALKERNTRFQLFTNDTYTRYANITDGKAGTTWQVGENWTLAYGTNPTQRVKVQIIDTKNGVMILDQVLQRGPDASMVPDLGLTRNDIVILFRNATFNDTNGPMADDLVTVNVTVRNLGPAAAYNFTVRVSDYSTLDRRSYPVMNANLDLNGTSSVNLTTQYRIPAGSWGMHTLSVRIVPLPNETRFANNYASADYRAGYTVIASHPGNPVLRIRSIESLPRFPVHGAYVNLTARISNQGGVPANATVNYYLGSVAPGNRIGVDTGLGVPVGGESVSTIVWRTPRGGTHNIIVNVTDPVSGSTDQALLIVEVLPTILLVDDDRAGDGGLRDVATSMKEALSSVAASYTVHTVLGGGDGPLFDAGERPLVDYDLVIWLTGYEGANTLTANDQTQLGRYLDNKGKLWLIGQDVLSGLGRTNPFLNNYMKVNPATPLGFLDAGLTNQIEGHGPLEGYKFTMNLPFPTGLTDRSDTMRYLPKGAAVFNETGGGNPYAILFNATTNGTPGDDTYKTSLFGFEPSRITSPNERSIMTYVMLEWFGVGATWGRDLGVSDQRFSKRTPAFMELVNITMYLRNNGAADEPVDQSRPQLQVGFYIDGIVFDPVSVTIEAAGGNTTFDPPTSEIWIPQDTGNASLKVPGRGGFIKVTMGWIADRIGEHTVLGRVDPYDYIQELNENNNEVAASLARTVFVRYGTLVVDDDGSPNNGGALYDSTLNITAALDQLGYSYDQVNTTGAGDGPGIARMELYNAIIWVAGQAGNALTAADKANLKAFLDKGDGRYLWLVGPRAIPNGDYTDGADPFVRDYLRVARVDNPVGQRTPGYIEGADLDPIAHGTRYPATPTYADAAHKLVPYNDGFGMLYQKPMPDTTTPNEIRYSDGKDGTTTGWYPRVIQPLTTSAITNVYDARRGQNVVQVARTGAHVNPNFYLVGDYSLTNDQNPNSLAWKEEQRFIAQWSFRSAIPYTFIWHLTDTSNVKHTLTYTPHDASSLGLEPVHHGLGAYTADDGWHTVTRDLLLDLREGAGGGLNIREVDGFEVAIHTGSARLDDVTLSRTFMALRHDNTTANFRTVVFGWDPSFISYTGNNDYNAELAYLVMSWFNMYDERTELRLTHLDVFHTTLEPLRDMKPMMGESYMLKARVWNPGGTRGDAVVRFSDGNTVIDSVAISVEHDSYALVEVIWTPLFAGSRAMSVRVDPDNLLDEVFEFNNDALIRLQVYFFYDDMEDGPGKWDHSSTIVRLNGESTLEYLDPGPVASDVQGEWASWNGWKNTTDNATLTNITGQYHSQNRAFYMHEPLSATRTPVDVILTSDATGSMALDTPASRMEGVKSAMFQFINRLQTSDRGAIASFCGLRAFNSNPNPPLIPFRTELHQALTGDKQLMSNAIANITVASNTPFWNAVVVSYTYIKDYGDPAHVRCVVILTDGDSNADQPDVATARATAFATVKTAPIPLFVIGYGASIHGTIVETRMINLAAEANQTGGGGGWYYYAPNNTEVGYVFANISKAIEELAQTLGRGETAGAASEQGAGARTVLFSDNMELGAGSWVVSDNAGAGSFWRYTTNDFQNSGIHAWRCYNGAANYVIGDDDWLITPAIDARGYHDLRLSFWHRPGLFRSNGGGCDFGYVFLSNDNGATWTGVRAFTNNLYNNNNANWESVTDVDLSVLPETAQMRVAFRLWSDPWNFATGWSIDDVTVTGALGYARSDEGAAAPQATVTILQEGFELAAPPGWATTNAAPVSSFWQRDGTFQHTDSYAFRCYDNGIGTYRKNDDDTLISPTFDLSGGYTSPLLTFWHRTDVKAGDKCYADISNNNGATWTNVWWSDTENNTWAAVLGLDMTASGSISLTNQMKLRFRFFSDNDNNVDTGWSVDDVLITAVTPTAGPPPSSYIASWNDGDETPRDKNITTPTFSLAGVSSAKLTFWHKYNLKTGSNGGVLQVGTGGSPTGPFTYRYITPTQPYPNNLKLSEWGSAHLDDDAGTDMRWCWNGISGAGRFSWDFVQVDLTPYVGNQYVRVKFLYLFCGGGTGFGWAIDDVEIRVHRSNAVAVTAAAADQWELVEEGMMYGDDFADGRFAQSGKHSWWNHNPRAGIDTLKGGIDNSLVTIPIDLSRAKDARLNAKLRFNILYPEGRPPDGFRVEVSSDNGLSWRQLNMGVRSAWNVSGTEAAGPDGTSYTGVDTGDNWVSAGTLTRLNCDLSGWSGSVIQIRFRVITRNDTVNHHQDLGPGFGGFFLDDVTVTGNTTTGQGRSAADDGREAGPLTTGFEPVVTAETSEARLRSGKRAAGSGEVAGSGQQAAGDDDGGRTAPATGAGSATGAGAAAPEGRVACPERRSATVPAARRPLPAAPANRQEDCWFPTE